MIFDIFYSYNAIAFSNILRNASVSAFRGLLSTETFTADLSASSCISSALPPACIKVGSNDIVEPGLDELLTKDMKIVIKRVKVKEEKQVNHI